MCHALQGDTAPHVAYLRHGYLLIPPPHIPSTYPLQVRDALQGDITPHVAYASHGCYLVIPPLLQVRHALQGDITPHVVAPGA